MPVEVILPVPLDRAFTYDVPEALAESVSPGARVVVPFGARRLTGVVTGHSSRDGEDEGELKSIESVLDERPSLTTELLQLTRWIADYYMTSWGLAVKAALPAGTDVTGDRDAPRVKVKTRPYVRLTNDPVDLESVRGARQRAILEILLEKAEEDETDILKKDLLKAASAATSSLNRLVEQGMVEILEKEVIRTPFGMASAPTKPPRRHDLHPAQKEALRAIKEATSVGRFATFLLHGITGSGKTEVYIEALKPVLARGQTGIVLVPEISLTPQTVRRFRSHLGDRVAVLHSKMSLGERYDTWRKLRDGAYSVAIGPRSAVLAPLENLGLIVVDEEHEPSYKQFDPAPRYHARDVAVVRARNNDAVCVLGSATPSLESYQNALRGKYTLLRMPERVPLAGGRQAQLPRVKRVDLAKERGKGTLVGTFSRMLREGISDRLERGEQVMLMLNRRGYAPILECQTCGWVPQCRDCAVSLTLHKRRQHLRCHYCGFAKRVPYECPECGEADFALLGTGTQRVETEVEELFPEARIVRMDLDTTSTKGSHFKILKRFGDGEADILVGTQMIAKGLDFPNVTLVGIINADTRLLMPDFRAAEHTFHLLAQVSGRSGRAEKAGEVILQTRNPRHDVIQRACRHDFEGFAQRELAERRQLGYPPFGRMIAIEFKGPEERAAETTAERWTEELRSAPPGGILVLGPEAAFISRLKKNYRFQTILKLGSGSDPASVKERLKATSEKVKGIGKTRIVVDVDPVSLL